MTILPNAMRLDEALRTVGIPIDGVSGNSPGAVRVDYSAEATQAQRAAGQVIVDGFDWSEATHGAWVFDKDFQAAASGPNLAAHKVAYGAMAAMAQKINAIIGYINGQGPVPDKIQIRTWEQILAEAKRVAGGG
jgi:hypothetical protein